MVAASNLAFAQSDCPRRRLKRTLEGTYGLPRRDPGRRGDRRFPQLTDEIRLVAHCDDGREVVAKLDNDVNQAVGENMPGSHDKDRAATGHPGDVRQSGASGDQGNHPPGSALSLGQFRNVAIYSHPTPPATQPAAKADVEAHFTLP